MNIVEYSPDIKIEHGMLVTNMPNEAYHAHPAISKSGLDLINRSPAHFKYRKPKEPTRAMQVGSAIHTAILEPERFAKEYVLLTETKDRRASEYKEAVKAVGSSDLVLVQTEADKVSGMYHTAKSAVALRQRLDCEGWAEISVFARDPVSDIMCKCRIDFLAANLNAVDLKKTQDARPESFCKSIFNYRYHVQETFYTDVFHWATGEHLNEFVFAAVEEELPHAVKVYEIDDLARMMGREDYQRDLDDYVQCLRSNEWPSLPCDEKELISLPSWAVNQYEEGLEEEII